MLSNKDFSSLLSSNRNNDGSKSRFTLDEIAALDKQNTKSSRGEGGGGGYGGKKVYGPGSGGWKRGNDNDDDLAVKEEGKAAASRAKEYRDRAAERREQLSIYDRAAVTNSANMNTLPEVGNSHILNADFDSAEKKGLDYSLLQKMRSTLASSSENTHNNNTSSELARNISNILFPKEPPQVRRNDTFTRQVYEFDIGANDRVDPTTVLRSKFEMSRHEERVIYQPAAGLIDKLRDAFARKLNSKRKRGQIDAKPLVVGSSNSSSSSSHQIDLKPLVVVDKIGDIFGGLEKYVPSEVVVQTAPASAKMVFEPVDDEEEYVGLAAAPASLQDIAPALLTNLNKQQPTVFNSSGGVDSSKIHRDILGVDRSEAGGKSMGYRLDEGTYDDDIYAIRDRTTMDDSDDDGGGKHDGDDEGKLGVSKKNKKTAGQGQGQQSKVRFSMKKGSG